MDLGLVMAFALATLAETLAPGPTLFLVLETMGSANRRSALCTVLGITSANLLWVVTAFGALYADFAWLDQSIAPLIGTFGMAYLLYLASRRLLASGVLLITGRGEATDRVAGDSSAGLACLHYLRTGFLAHAGNPLTISYYMVTFSIAILGESVGTVLAFGTIAILSDLLIYAGMTTIVTRSTDALFRTPFVRLAAGVFLFFFITRAFSAPGADSILSIAPLTMLFLLLGLVLAALAEARQAVLGRKGKNNRFLWRVAGLWRVWFSVYALLGTVYSLVDGLGASAMELSGMVEDRLRICVVVAAVLAVALSFAKAFGDLQEEQDGEVVGQGIDRSCWQCSPVLSGLVTAGILVAVFLLLTLTGFRVQ